MPIILVISSCAICALFLPCETFRIRIRNRYGFKMIRGSGLGRKIDQDLDVVAAKRPVNKEQITRCSCFEELITANGEGFFFSDFLSNIFIDKKNDKKPKLFSSRLD